MAEEKKYKKGSQEYKDVVEQQYEDVYVIMHFKMPKELKLEYDLHSEVGSWIQEAFDNRCSDCGYREREMEFGAEHPDGYVYNHFLVTKDKKEIDTMIKTLENDKSWINETEDFIFVEVTHKEAIEKYLGNLFDLIDTSKEKRITIKLSEFATVAYFNMQNALDVASLNDSSKQHPRSVYRELRYVLCNAGIVCDCEDDFLQIISLRRKTEEDYLPRIYHDDYDYEDSPAIFVEIDTKIEQLQGIIIEQQLIEAEKYGFDNIEDFEAWKVEMAKKHTELWKGWEEMPGDDIYWSQLRKSIGIDNVVEDLKGEEIL